MLQTEIYVAPNADIYSMANRDVGTASAANRGLVLQTDL